MTEGEICSLYRRAKYKSRQISILVELNGTNKLEIMKILLKNGEKLPEGDINQLYKRLDDLEEQIVEREKEYRMIANMLIGSPDIV